MTRTHFQLSTVYWLALALVLLAALACPAPALGAIDFTFSPQEPLAGQTVTFTAADLRPSDAVQWDFESDGTFDATGATAQHTYPTAGLRTVLMRVLRADSQPRDVSKGVEVHTAPAAQPPNRPPIASFIFYPRAPLSGESLELVSTSFDVDGPLPQHAWDLDGDGQFDDSFGITAFRSFAVPGLYTVALRVTDTRGASDVESRAIVVGAPAVASSGSQLMSPFPVVRMVGRSTPWGARINLLAVRSAPRGTRATVRCRGRGCRRRRDSRTVRSGRLRFRSFERPIGAGARIEVFVTQPGKIGKYTSFRIRRMRPPLRRDLCVTSVTARPVRCPSS